MIVNRIFSVGAGTVTDLWREDKRGQAMGMIFFGQFLGSLLGPVIGGILTRELSWRANFWSCVIMSGLLTAMTFLFVTETYFVDAGFYYYLLIYFYFFIVLKLGLLFFQLLMYFFFSYHRTIYSFRSQ